MVPKVFKNVCMQKKNEDNIFLYLFSSRSPQFLLTTCNNNIICICYALFLPKKLTAI